MGTGGLPLGGYVKMLDEREEAVVEHELPRAFNRQSVTRRSFVVIAGPAANLLLAVLVYWLVFMSGTEAWRPILAAPQEGTPAAEADVNAGETVRSLSGTVVTSWSELRWEVLQRALDRETVTLETIDEHGNIAIHRLDTSRLDGPALETGVMAALGLRLMRPKLPPVLGEVLAGSPAAVCRLASGRPHPGHRCKAHLLLERTSEHHPGGWRPPTRADCPAWRARNQDQRCAGNRRAEN